MASLLSVGGAPRKVGSNTTQVKKVVLEIFQHLDLVYNGVQSTDGCLIIMIPYAQLERRNDPDKDKTLGIFSGLIAKDPANHPKYKTAVVLVQKEEWAAMSVMDEHKEKLDAWATLDGKAWTPRLTEADTALPAWQELLIQVDSLSEGLGHPIMTELQNHDTAEAVRSCIYEHCGDANVDADGLQNWWEANKRRRLQ